MTDRPIIFSAPMIKALLAERKTQTRRIINPQPTDEAVADGSFVANANRLIRPAPIRFAVGDRLWVRENGLESLRARTFRLFAHDAEPGDYWVDSDGGRYGASYGPAVTRASMIKSGGWKVRPSIHMPRWASRLTLLVTEVRVQRLQDIDGIDACAEGALWLDEGRGAEKWGVPGAVDYQHEYPVGAFAALWSSIHGADAWAENPWIVAVSFTVHLGNIDALPVAA